MVAVVLLGSCSGEIAVVLGDVSSAAGYVAGHFAYQKDDPGIIGFSSRVFDFAGTYVPGTHGGYVWFNHTEFESPFTGTADFDSFSVEAPQGGILIIDGMVNFEASGADGSWSASFDGTLNIGKDALEPRAFVADLGCDITITYGDPDVATVAVAGTVNSVPIERLYQFPIIMPD